MMALKTQNPMTDKPTTPEQDMVDALYIVWNIIGAAKAASQHLGAYKDLDVDWHDNEIRKAVIRAEEELGLTFS